MDTQQKKVEKDNKNCVRCGEYDINIKKKVLMNDVILFCIKCLNKSLKAYEFSSTKEEE